MDRVYKGSKVVYYQFTMKRRDRTTTQEILNFIVRYKLANDGISPTLQEIADQCDAVSHKSVVKYHLDALVDAGYIEKEHYNYRTIKVIGAEWTPPIWYEVQAPAQ